MARKLLTVTTIICVFVIHGYPSTTVIDDYRGNPVPIADAGPDQTILENNIATFNGSDSQGSSGLVAFGKNVMVNEVSEVLAHYGPRVVVDDYGTIHVAWCGPILNKGFYVHYQKSTDGGLTFQKSLRVSDSIDTGASLSCALEMEVDDKGHVHLVWTDKIDSPDRVMYYSNSTDGGVTFGTPLLLIQGNRSISLGIAVDEIGIIHIAFYNEGNFYVVKSDDGGVTFGEPTRINDVNGTSEGGRIVLDEGNNIHAVWVDNRDWASRNLDVFYAVSDDGGSTFGKGIRVADEEETYDVVPSLAVDKDGGPHVVWMDESGPGSVVYYSTSHDGGKSFELKTKIVESLNMWRPRIRVGYDGMPQIVVMQWGMYPYCFNINYTRMNPVTKSFQSMVSVNDDGGMFPKYNPDIDIDSNGVAHVVWSDKRNGNIGTDIFYAKSGPGYAKIVSYEWDMNNFLDSDGDGNLSNDIDATGPTPTFAYGDDGVYTATLKVTDETGASAYDTTTVTVLNVDPMVSEVSYDATGGTASILFRVAGEKWHNVEVHLYEEYVEIGYANITRFPGSPNDQMVTLADIPLDFSKKYSAIAYYTPEDDPLNGRILGTTPTWFILRFDDEEMRIHHAFNVRHEETWVWNIDDMNQYFPVVVTFEASACDRGSDDLEFTWDFGDGTLEEHIYYNNGISPDPPMSPEINPIGVTDTAKRVYSGTGSYTVVLTVMDDDGGSQSYRLTVDI